MLRHRRLERRTIEPAGDLGEALRHAGMGRLEDHDVDRVQGAEFLGPAPADAELVMVDHHVGRQEPHRRVKRPGLGLAQQQVIAIEVGAAGQHAPVGRRAVGVAARHDDDAHPGEQRLQLARRQRGSQRQHRLAAGRLVAVLLADQPDHRPVEARDRGRIVEAFLREVEQRQVAALLRLAETGQPQVTRRAGEPGQERRQIVLAGKRRRRGDKSRALQRNLLQRRVVDQNRIGLAIVGRRPLRGRAAR